MEDEGGVKAPVTRRRGRLSVEQSDESKSSAPSTPTKKRGGRRVAKTDLDLIEENGSEIENSKKTINKPIKELEVEEKPLTPSRRSARIKSNTSLVLETTQTVDSPRAKRATRRNSQVGSDNEAPLTPARITRRTRRDSANSDKAEPTTANKTVVPITEIIVEEPETTLQKTQSNADTAIEQSHSPSGLRKSPRLSLKNNNRSDSNNLNVKEKKKSEKPRKSNSRDSSEFDKDIDKSDEHNHSNKENKTSEDAAKPENVTPVIKLVDISNNLNDMENNRLSVSNVELLNRLNDVPKKTNKNLNNSSSAMMDANNESLKMKRQRTKSWTGLSHPMQNESKCYSDSESTKKIKRTNLNTSNNDEAQNISDNLRDNSFKKEKINSVQDTSVQEEEKSSTNPSNNAEKILSSVMNISNSSTNLFEKDPACYTKTIVYIDESDSNPEKINMNKEQVNEHDQEKSLSEEKIQNISNINQDSKENTSSNKYDSCEPMDIDETLPDNSISNKLPLETTEKSENKIVTNENVEIECSGNDKSKSKRSSIISNTSQVLDKTAMANKSTLLLSELKDTSNENNVSQSSQIVTDKKSTTDQSLNITQDSKLNKKKLSSNYLTSTPLQQKSLIKQSMQVNTSGIDSKNTSKIDKSSSKLNGSNTNKSNNTSEEIGSDDSSDEESNFEDNEAEDAGDDYESGDSRDEEDEQYEKDHEIVQRGETLTSEDELSNDSDYEKDSFVVSSDQDDDDLLDGSGDDLSMSDKELKMTSKSKEKYNERKQKEQKKASREMFESRHKLNVSNKSNKSDSSKMKKNRAVIESSDSEDEDIQIKIKKNKRLRLDSSHETSLINKSSENTSKLQPNISLTNENVINEVEMTIIEHGVEADTDPLTLDIKKEPKTPQKEQGNMSIQFIDPEQSENPNKSHINMTLADDPLEEGDSSESSDSNINEHIQNYDSVLNDLNKSIKTKKSKDDISLNIDKKPKKKSVPIIDQLNITQIKEKKKKQTKEILETSKQSVNDKSVKESNTSLNKSHVEKDNKKKSASKTEDSDNESSASIDLHLLFSEDSNNSEDVNDKVNDKNNEDDNFISLKNTPGKTDIFETSASSNNNESVKKTKKKNKTLDKSNLGHEDCVDGSEPLFFLDTTGTHDSKTDDTSLNAITTKKLEQHKAIDHEDSDSDSPMEVSNKSVSEQANVKEIINASIVSLNKSNIKTPKSDKKKKRKESLTMEQTDNTEVQPVIKDDFETKLNQSGITDKSINKSVSKTPKSEKMKYKRLSESQMGEDKKIDSDASQPMNASIILAQEQQLNIEEALDSSTAVHNKSITKTPKSDKKKRKSSVSQTNDQTGAEIEQNRETIEKQSDVANKSINDSVSKTPKSEKKKAKRISESQMEQKDEYAIKESEIQDDIKKQDNQTDAVDKSVDKSLTKREKKKKKLSQIQADIEIGLNNNETLNKSSSSEKKKAKNIMESNEADHIGNVVESKEVNSKKRKRKSSDAKEAILEDVVPSHESHSQNKKIKVSHDVEDLENIDQAPVTKNTAIEKQRNKDNMKQKHPLLSENNNRDNADILNNKKVMKKRKEREDDEGSIIAKVPKVNTDDKVLVPRLPNSILNQLEDKPTKKSLRVIKPNAISTTNFVVEETKIRKNKPSNYLEESVYLNDDEEEDTKKPKQIMNPKVLPTLPTASTSSSGYTTDFKVNILPKQIQFVAKSTAVSNYKNDYLQTKKIKRMGTYELYKRNRTVKMSKF